jgi:cytoskeletal protein RodZ
VIRPRGGTTNRREDQDASLSSAREIGRQLREARVERGLDLLAAHDRLSRPITQLEALENGDLAALPDQALALSTLRRYAAFLGLDGDALALRMIDAWSSAARHAGDSGAEATRVTAAVTSGPDNLRSFTQTGQVPRVGARFNATAAVAAVMPSTGPPTGTFPVVPRQELKHSKRAVAKARRRLRAPAALKAITWTIVALLVIAVAGFAIYQWSPQWLVNAHILRVTGHPVTTTLAGSSSAPAASVVTETSSTAQSGSFVVNASSFDTVIATSGPCWIQVTSSTTSTPLAVGVQPAGKNLAFPNKGTMTVQVGSSAVIVAITVDGKGVYLNKPTTTPFTYTFSAKS